MKTNYIFLDIDGVLTSTEETPGSYINHRPEDYGLSDSCVKRLLKLIDAFNAKVIVSSNWRRFEDGESWSFKGGFEYLNPLPKLKAILGKRYAGDLTHERYLTKSQALELWFEDTGLDWKALNYVIFDDDTSEGFSQSKFSSRFILTQCKTGLTETDCEKAVQILKNKNKKSKND